MAKVRQTDVFTRSFGASRDRHAAQRIVQRIHRLAMGNAGRNRILKGGVHELKIDYGPSYRMYYVQHGETLIILLCGGD